MEKLDSIYASPTGTDPNSSIHSQRLHRRNKRKLLQKIDTTLPAQHIQGNSQIEQKEEVTADDNFLYHADLFDCMRAREEARSKQTLPSSKDFITLENLVLSQNQHSSAEAQKQDDTREALDAWNHCDSTSSINNDELIDICNDAIQKAKEAVLVPKGNTKTIAEAILDDFCLSPTYTEDDVSDVDVLPYFRFRGKKLKTYSRAYRNFQQIKIEEEDERLSCSSDLSIQEDHSTSMLQSTIGNLDANSSQLICENLFNLSAYFRQSDKNVNISEKTSILVRSTENEATPQVFIDLPLDVKAESPAKRLKIEQDYLEAEMKALGYTFGSENFESDTNDIECESEHTKADQGASEYTMTNNDNSCNNLIFKSCNRAEIGNTNSQLITDKGKHNVELPTVGPPQQDDKANKDASNDHDVHMDWFNGDNSVFENFTTQDFLNEAKMTFSEKENQDNNNFVDINTLKDNTQSFQHKSKTRCIKSSNADAGLTTDTKAYIKPEYDIKGVTNDCKSIETGFCTALNKAITVSEGARERVIEMMAGIEEQPTDKCERLDVEDILTAWRPTEAQVNDPVEFRTASNKAIRVSNEMQARVAMLMADIDSNETKQSYADAIYHGKSDIEMISTNMHGNIQYRTASVKGFTVLKDEQERMAKVMADVEASTSKQQTHKANEFEEFNIDDILTEWGPSDVQDNKPVEFRTASNKAILVSDEVQERVAMLMADIDANETKQSHDTANCEINNMKVISTRFEPPDLSNIEFRTASNKAITVSEEVQERVAKLMAGVTTQPIDTAELLNECQPSDITELDNAELSTRPNKVKADSDGVQIQRGAKLMADSHVCTGKQTPSTSHSNLKYVSTPENPSELRQLSGIIEHSAPLNKEISVSVEAEKQESKAIAVACSKSTVEIAHNLKNTDSDMIATPKQSKRKRLYKSPSCSSLDTAKGVRNNGVIGNHGLSLKRRRILRVGSDNSDLKTVATPTIHFSPLSASASTPVCSKSATRLYKDVQESDIKNDSIQATSTISRLQNLSTPRTQLKDLSNQDNTETSSPVCRRVGLRRTRNK